MPCIMYGQEKDTVRSRTFYDVTSQFPVFKIYQQKKKIEIDYYTTLDTISMVSINVGFNGGVERLNKYCDSLYFSKFSEKDYRELNVRVMYSILFNNKLKIQEIHILERPFYKNDEYNYDKLVKEILFSTNGQWSKKGKDSDKYLYVGFFHLK